MAASFPLPNVRLLLSVGVGAGVAIVTGIGYWYYSSYKKNQIPTKWRRVGTLEEIYIFPVKSCGPIRLEDEQIVECELLGMQLNDILDRSLILLDRNNEIVTGRTYPKLVIIKTEIIDKRKLRITATPDQTPLEINFDTFSSADNGKKLVVTTSLFGTKVKVLLCGEAYDKWFSQAVLGQPDGLKLAYYPHENPVRAVDKSMKHEPYITRMDTGTLGDATSYMLMNLASIDDLNTRLAKPVSPIQFRGNFYINMDSDTPYAEDDFSWLKIGDNAVFRVVAPCTRCIMPNINYTSGERDADGEPLRTLKTYRKIENYKSPQLGVHMGLRQRGSVKMHDVIYVEDQ